MSKKNVDTEYDEDNMREAPSKEVDYLLKNVKDMSDLYFLSLVIIGKLQESSKHSMLAELTYLIDTQSFINLLWYYEGQTITIPTRAQLKETLELISLYYNYDILGKSWNDTLEEMGISKEQSKSRKLWGKYKKFKEDLVDVKFPKDLRMPRKDDLLEK